LKASSTTKETYKYQQYIDDVLSGKILVCKCVRKAVQRHVRDLERVGDPDYPYCFKANEANKVIRFFKFLKGNEGQFYDKPIDLLPWQQFVIAMIFGWRRKSDGLRRYRKAYIEIAKKQGKSTMASGLQLFGMTEEPGAQVYSIAGKRDQAAITFDAAWRMIEKSPDLLEIYTLSRAAIESDLKGRHGTYKALSSDYSTSDGLNASLLVVDEYHAFQNSKLVNAVESGMIMRRQPLTLIITTAGGNKSGPCYELYHYVKKVLDGIIADDTFFGIIYELDDTDDWQDKTKYIKAAPSLNVITPMESLTDKLRLAKSLASEEWEFRSKILGQWLDVLNVWIDADLWAKNQTAFDPATLLGRDCWLAIDLSKTRDLTALSLCFPFDGKYRMLHYCFIPEEAIQYKQEQEHVMIRRWISEGLIIPTPGLSVDYDYLLTKIADLAKQYTIKEVCFDPYNANNIDEKLEGEGFVPVAIRQGITYFSPLTKAWERDVLRGQIEDNNPVMAWCLSNAVIKPDKANGNIKPLKQSEGQKIDLVITSIMAHSRATAPQAEPEETEYDASQFDFS
jgi:phage terminase large subunit-like protein